MNRLLTNLSIAGLATAFVLGLACASAQAVVVDNSFTLIDNNSQVVIDPTSQAGMKAWKVNGINYDAKQWFWYRIGSSGGEHSLDTLGLISQNLSDSNSDGNLDTAILTYGNNNVGITLNTRVIGFDAGGSDIAELIQIKNKTATQMELHFFQYNNFLLSTPPQDTVLFNNLNSVTQTGPHDILQENYNWGEAVVTGYPKHEAAAVSTTLDSLNDSDPTTFTNIDGPVTGNVSWAFQWDLSIAPGKTVAISKDKLLNVPEPSSIVLLSIFGACLAIGCWNKKRSA